MPKKGEKKNVRRFGLEKLEASPEAKAEAAAFLAKVESRRRALHPTRDELTPLKARLAEQIEKAFSGGKSGFAASAVADYYYFFAVSYAHAINLIPFLLLGLYRSF